MPISLQNNQIKLNIKKLNKRNKLILYNKNWEIFFNLYFVKHSNEEIRGNLLQYFGLNAPKVL